MNVAAAAVTPNSKLFEFLAKLPKGTFFDINTSRKGQLSYCASDIGGYGAWTFKKTIEEDLLRIPNFQWSDFEQYWQDRLSNIRSYNAFGRLVRKQQQIDVKKH